jgi:hypothetical protein
VNIYRIHWIISLFNVINHLGIACSKEELLIFVIARVMFLILCHKKGLTPYEFLIAQIYGGCQQVTYVYQRVRTMIQNYSINALQTLLSNLVHEHLDKVQIGIAIDEINAHATHAPK